MSAASSRFRVLRRSSRAPHTAILERTKALLPGANGLRGRSILIAAGVEVGRFFVESVVRCALLRAHGSAPLQLCFPFALRP
jgi:hypothetical protein